MSPPLLLRPTLTEHGIQFPPVPGEVKFPPKSNIFLDPHINLVTKIVEILRGDETGPHYFGAVEIGGRDLRGSGLAPGRVPHSMDEFVALLPQIIDTVQQL